MEAPHRFPHKMLIQDIGKLRLMNAVETRQSWPHVMRNRNISVCYSDGEIYARYFRKLFTSSFLCAYAISSSVSWRQSRLFTSFVILLKVDVRRPAAIVRDQRDAKQIRRRFFWKLMTTLEPSRLAGFTTDAVSKLVNKCRKMDLRVLLYLSRVFRWLLGIFLPFCSLQ